MTRPAQQLALVLADLPPGFEVMEELAPALYAGAGGAGGREPDPWGRVSAYAVTFGAPPGRSVDATMGDVVSSVNAYTGVDQANAAFANWRAAVPNVYQLAETQPADLADGVALYLQRRGRASCLVGFRLRNVMASVWVGAPAGSADPPERAALEYARLVTRRIRGGR